MIRRQLIVAMTQKGVIGVDKELFFSTRQDLSNFVAFTDHTVLIAGRVTGEQLIRNKVKITGRRPLVCITGGYLETPDYHQDEHIYYAPNIVAALKLAEGLCESNDLCGYSVIGGKQVYDEYLDLVDSGKTRPNVAYIFEPLMEPSGSESGVVTLHRDLAQTKALLNARMIEPKSESMTISAVGLPHTGIRLRGDGSFHHVTDNREISFDEAGFRGQFLKVQTDTGVFSVKVSSITGWFHREGVNSVDLMLDGKEDLNLRPKTIAGLNTLLLSLKMIQHI